MENFIITFEEHLLEKSLNEGIHSLLTGTFNKKEAIRWLLGDGLKYITVYLMNHPNNKITEPFINSYIRNKEDSNGFTEPDKICDKFLGVLNHFKSTLSSRIKGGETSGNASSNDIDNIPTWEDAENNLLSLTSGRMDI